MRYVDRSSVDAPESLCTPCDNVKAEMDAAKTFYQTYDPAAPGAKAFEFKEYKPFEVQSKLRILFKNKCAYCEAEILDDMDVEHFRPKGAVLEDPSHHGYWWLAHTWNNLLASCSHCNQKRRQHLVTEAMTAEQFLALQAKEPKTSYGKMNQFPIDGVRATYTAQDITTERPYLINPTDEDPEPFFRWSAEGLYSIVLAKPTDALNATRALTSISVFALNRLWLVQSRTNRLNELRVQKYQILDALAKDAATPGLTDHLNNALLKVRALRELHGEGKPYSAMVKAFLDEFQSELVARL